MLQDAPQRIVKSAVTPFQVRSFRFQWPADLFTSWAFEMELLILGWYVLVETNSVLLLTAFGSLQFLGTLIAPMFGVLADRLGRRKVLCAMRASYACLAIILMMLAITETLNPYYVLTISFMAGLIKPSDLVMRNALIGDTVPRGSLAKAMGLSRTTMDSARIAGALAGAGLFSTIGIGPSYIVVVCVYCISLILTFGVSRSHLIQPIAKFGVKVSRIKFYWWELRSGFIYIWKTPELLAIMLLAFLVNLTAYPISMGLLPYVAKEIYAIDQSGLGQLVAGYATGALLGSIAMILLGDVRHTGRIMIIGIVTWYLLMAIFAIQDAKWPGFVVLLAIGIAQSGAMIAMSVALLRITPEKYRGRIMGVRMLAVYGLPLGLLAAGFSVERAGFSISVWIYVLLGLLCTCYITAIWRREIWH